MTLTASTEPMPTRNSGRVVSIVAGAVLLLLSLAPLAGGTALTAVHTTQRGDDGYYATGTEPLSTPTAALVSDDLDVDMGGADWMFDDGRFGSVRVTATGTDDRPVFVGIARSADADAYLGGVAHDVVTDFEVDPFSVTTSRHPGALRASAPATQGFWVASAQGAGTQSMTWPAEDGDWSVVVMNADGSPGVATDASVGAKIDSLLWIGIGLLVVGAVAGVAGGALVSTGAKRP
jgi:hypothetical protein